MSFIITGKSQFVPAPAGIHLAVCVDLTPIKDVQTAWGPKKRFRIVWEIDKKMENGKPFLASKSYSPTLNERSTLRKDLKSWRGREFTPAEIEGFDMENIIGAACNIAITHEEKGEKLYANITAIVPAAGVKLAPTGNYVRIKDRPDYKPDAPKSESSHPDIVDNEHEDSSDQPF